MLARGRLTVDVFTLNLKTLARDHNRTIYTNTQKNNAEYSLIYKWLYSIRSKFFSYNKNSIYEMPLETKCLIFSTMNNAYNFHIDSIGNTDHNYPAKYTFSLAYLIWLLSNLSQKFVQPLHLTTS